MIAKTRALVLKTFPHGDRSLILRAYTRSFGLRSYFLNPSKRMGFSKALVQPLTTLELVVDEQAERDLQRVREMNAWGPSLHGGSVVKGAMVLFLQEVYLHALKEESADDVLFDHLVDQLDLLATHEQLGNFHLWSLLRLSDHLGFSPEKNNGASEYFDLKEGCFTPHPPVHALSVGPPCGPILAELITLEAKDALALNIPYNVRQDLLHHLLRYFQIHVHGFGELRSPSVLHTVLS